MYIEKRFCNFYVNTLNNDLLSRSRNFFILIKNLTLKKVKLHVDGVVVHSLGFSAEGPEFESIDAELYKCRNFK
jgi:hypothetical protein